MITDIILYIFSFFLSVIGNTASFISGDWHIWPTSVLSGFTYFCQNLMTFNIIFPIDQLLIALHTLITFLTIYLAVRLLMKIFNWVRGSGPIDI